MLRTVGAVLLAGLLLGLAVPVLRTRGYELSQWIVIPVIAFTAVLLLGPPLLRARREHDRRF